MSAAVLKKSLVITGGGQIADNAVSMSVIFIPQLNKSRNIVSLKEVRSGHVLVECRNKLYAIGGMNSDHYFLSSAECLSDLKGKWTNIASMNVSRRSFAAVNCNNVIYAIGGQSGRGGAKALKSVVIVGEYMIPLLSNKVSSVVCLLEETLAQLLSLMERFILWEGLLVMVILLTL